MGARLTMTAETEEADAFFEELTERMKGRRAEVVTYVGKVLVSQLKENIDREDGGEFGGWAPLAARTVAERERLGYGGAHPILKRTEDLYRSNTYSTGQDYAEAGPERTAFYAEFHDKGIGQMQRSFVHVADPVFVEMLESLGAYFIENKPLPFQEAS